MGYFPSLIRSFHQQNLMVIDIKSLIIFFLEKNPLIILLKNIELYYCFGLFFEFRKELNDF